MAMHRACFWPRPGPAKLLTTGETKMHTHSRVESLGNLGVYWLYCYSAGLT